jgi:hypothetical protein
MLLDRSKTEALSFGSRYQATLSALSRNSHGVREGMERRPVKCRAFHDTKRAALGIYFSMVAMITASPKLAFLKMILKRSPV